MAIDEAGFTPEFFKKSDNIRDLFEGEDIGDDVPQQMDDAPRNQRELDKVLTLYFMHIVIVSLKHKIYILYTLNLDS